MLGLDVRVSRSPQFVVDFVVEDIRFRIPSVRWKS